MKRAILILALTFSSVLVGQQPCCKSSLSAIERLNQATAPRGLVWTIRCMNPGNNSGFPYLGWAQPKEMPDSAFYIEDGAKPWWYVKAMTQEQAVTMLTEEVGRRPTVVPKHSPNNMVNKECDVKSLTGGATDEYEASLRPKPRAKKAVPKGSDVIMATSIGDSSLPPWTSVPSFYVSHYSDLAFTISGSILFEINFDGPDLKFIDHEKEVARVTDQGELILPAGGSAEEVLKTLAKRMREVFKK
jgi:hypothetical protein